MDAKRGEVSKGREGGQQVKRFRNERERCKEKDEFVYIFYLTNIEVLYMLFSLSIKKYPTLIKNNKQKTLMCFKGV